MRHGVQLMAMMLTNGVGNQQQKVQMYGQRDKYMGKVWISYIPFEEVEYDVTIRSAESTQDDESSVRYQVGKSNSTEDVIQTKDGALPR